MNDEVKSSVNSSLNKNQLVAVAVALLVVGAFVYWSYTKTNSSTEKMVEEKTVEIVETNTKQIMNNISTIKGLEIYDEVVGTGAEAKAGQKISVHYVGTLTTGQKFDSSVDRGMPFEFTLGAGRVIQGWDKGFAGMKVGGKRKLVIAPEMGYGAQEIPGVIPANSTLLFEVQLLGVK